MIHQRDSLGGAARDVAGPVVEARDAGSSRRGFLRKSAVGAAAVGAGAAVLGAGGRAEAQNSSNAQAARNFRQIQADENNHVTFLVAVLGANARPKPNFQNLVFSNFRAFTQLSAIFENTGVRAYGGAAPFVADPGTLAAAGAIAAVEAYHSGYLNTYIGQPLTPGGTSFIFGATPGEVAEAVAPYVRDLNGGPPLTYGPTRSPQNDLAILNFALALEYLEAEYYNINVPRFFRGR